MLISFSNDTTLCILKIQKKREKRMKKRTLAAKGFNVAYLTAV